MTSEISISSNDSSVPGVVDSLLMEILKVRSFPSLGTSSMGLITSNGPNQSLCSLVAKAKRTISPEPLKLHQNMIPTTKWNSENHMVMSWLINTMNLEIGQNFMFYGTAKEIWENVKETYSDNENTSELFEIKGILHNLQQGDASVTQYYNLLTRYWQQLDMFEKITWDCQLDKKKYDQIVEKERIFKLLLGLNKDLDEVRGRILGTKPLPSLREAFSEVRREECRKKIMMGRPGFQNSGESSALAAYGTNYKGSDNQPHKGRPWCDHCRRPGHIKEKCWKIHGKPADWKPRKPQPENRGYVATTEEKPISEDVVFSKEQLELLQNMFNQAQINPPVIRLGTIAQKGIFPSALNSKVEKSNPWVIDTGASDHMTGDISLFSSYSACSNNYKVRIADGSLSTVSGMGSIVISPSITLDYVLLVPSLSCNLLSISKLTKDLKCVANFFPIHCIFQDQNSGKMIGNARSVRASIS
ncbi:hypothetical protein RJ639_036229 [Escallonia herrerae]|uniref:Retrovirus-related Pol polyprotein from transposon TNT 1-94-like beta-barrel domain-containing protein n=1 Tax=Escallonia herrerae TaxID=1293975 RepID=A0AA88WWH2_9ASTE|nr:hypothetical protein RJ639_036229 [Escallonia herrerae]